MGIKLKALCLGLLAMVATGALTAASATAEGGGDFDLGAGATTITGIENEAHNLVFEKDTGGLYDCTEAAYHAGAGEETTESLTVAFAWGSCFPEGSETEFPVHENGCTLRFTVGPNAEADNTVDVCHEAGPVIITEPNCEFTIPAQTAEGVAYTEIEVNGKQAITLDVTLKLDTQYHGGACQILGTSHTMELAGSATFIGEDDVGEPVDLRATGSESEGHQHATETAATHTEETAATHTEETAATHTEETAATHTEETAATHTEETSKTHAEETAETSPAGGHFSAGAEPTTFLGFENDETHNLEFVMDTGGEVNCEEATYHGVGSGGTQESVTVTADWSECSTTNGGATFSFHENGCTLELTVGAEPEGFNTVHVCGEGGPVEITHPNCLITVPTQSVDDVAYTAIEVNGKDAITMDWTITFVTQYHGGACQILGTNHTAELVGSMTLVGQDEEGNPVDIAATGE